MPDLLLPHCVTHTLHAVQSLTRGFHDHCGVHPSDLLSWLQGHTQGPCSVVEFEQWLKRMASDRSLLKEYKEFQEVSVWTVSHIIYSPLLKVLVESDDISVQFFHCGVKL